MASLVDDGQLAITLEAPRNATRPRWRFTFDTCAGYRNLLEEFRLELWAHLDSTAQRCGTTFTVVHSPWIETLREKEGLFAAHYPAIQHYVFLTEDDVIEVLSPSVPTIEALGATPKNEPAAGKSAVFYNPEDRDKIEETLSSLSSDSHRWRQPGDGQRYLA